MFAVKNPVKKLAVIVMAAVMVMATGITAFAASPGQYGVELNVTLPEGHGNPFRGADVTYDESQDRTTITLYTQDIEAETSGHVDVTGYVKTLTVEDEVAVPDEESHPSEFTFVLDGEYEIGTSLDFEFSIEMKDSNGNTYTHPSVNAAMTIVDR